MHDTSALGRVYPDVPDVVACGGQCFAVHYPVPADWMTERFDDSGWPPAHLFTHAEMGLDNQAAYRDYADAFGEARVIWSQNLVFDNLVLARRTVP